LELGVVDAVMELDGMSPGFAVKLGENEVKTVEDVAGLVPDDLTGWRENNKEGKPVWQDGILKKGEMRKDDAQLFIMKARVIAGWIEPEALEQLEADMAAEAAGEEPQDLTEEERALLALGELGKSTASDDAVVDETLDVSDEDILAELEGLDLDEDLLMEGGDDAAEPQ
jgi:transcription termination/antitermination protein NusA